MKDKDWWDEIDIAEATNKEDDNDPSDLETLDDFDEQEDDMLEDET